VGKDKQDDSGGSQPTYEPHFFYKHAARHAVGHGATALPPARLSILSCGAGAITRQQKSSKRLDSVAKPRVKKRAVLGCWNVAGKHRQHLNHRLLYCLYDCAEPTGGLLYLVRNAGMGKTASCQ